MAQRSKTDALRDEGTLNPRASAVTDPRFQDGEFFDPNDIVQVKYEMLRRVRVDEVPVTQAAAEFGFSRPTFYQAESSFADAGIGGLVPDKRGPRGPHKLSPEVLAFIAARVTPDGPIRARELAKQLLAELGVEVHPRSIERAVGPRKKTPS